MKTFLERQGLSATIVSFEGSGNAYQIDHNIPIPPVNNKGREKGHVTYLAAALFLMKVGDSMLLPRNQADACRALIMSIKFRRIFFKITQRIIDASQARIWRIK